MSEIKLKSLLLKEQFHVSSEPELHKAAKVFAEALIKNKIIATHHEQLTGADANPLYHVEDISAAISNAIHNWMDNANSKNHQ